MATYITENQPDLSLDEGKFYRAILTEVVPREIRWVPKAGPDAGMEQCKILLEWWWEVQDESLRNPAGFLRKVKGTCEAKLTNHADNKFHSWAEALLQRDIEVGVPVDTDDLVALPADISVKKVPDKKDPSKLWDEVAEVLPCIDGGPQDLNPPF